MIGSRYVTASVSMNSPFRPASDVAIFQNELLGLKSTLPRVNIVDPAKKIRSTRPAGAPLRVCSKECESALKRSTQPVHVITAQTSTLVTSTIGPVRLN